MYCKGQKYHGQRRVSDTCPWVKWRPLGKIGQFVALNAINGNKDTITRPEKSQVAEPFIFS